MTTTKNKPAVYVGTYGKYNNGSIEGKWLDLSEYSSIEEFYEACRELHKDEEGPEFMFQDFENIPKGFIGESWISDNIFEALEILAKIQDMSESELVGLHNQWCDSTYHFDDQIYYNDEEFFETCFSGRTTEAVRAAIYGDYNCGSDWVTFNGYGNLQSVHNVTGIIDTEEILQDILENPGNYSI
jgi:antirestriction protein